MFPTGAVILVAAVVGMQRAGAAGRRRRRTAEDPFAVWPPRMPCGDRPGHGAARAVGGVRGDVPRLGDDQGAGRAGGEGRRREHDRDDDRDASGRQDGVRDGVRGRHRTAAFRCRATCSRWRRRADAVAAASRRASSRTRASTRSKLVGVDTVSVARRGRSARSTTATAPSYGEQVDFWIDDSVGPIGLIRLEAEQKQHPTIRAGFKFELVATGNDAVRADHQAGPAVRRGRVEEARAAVDAADARRAAASGEGGPMTYVGRHGAQSRALHRSSSLAGA